MALDTPYSVTVTAHDRLALDADLDAAVQTAIEHALAGQSHGVLVTRRDPASYLVEVTDEVPFGFTHERDLYYRIAHTAKDSASQ